jgi:hypothetical protein
MYDMGRRTQRSNLPFFIEESGVPKKDEKQVRNLLERRSHEHHGSKPLS